MQLKDKSSSETIEKSYSSSWLPIFFKPTNEAHLGDSNKFEFDAETLSWNLSPSSELGSSETAPLLNLDSGIDEMRMMALANQQ